MTQDRISFIIRTTLSRDINYLHRAIASIFTNQYSNIEIIIVYQGTQMEKLEEINTLSLKYPSIKFQVLHNNTNVDERSKNLNLGIKGSTGRFIAFLDDDDQIMPHYINSIIPKLIESGRAWALCKTLINSSEKKYIVKRIRKFNYIRLLVSNYICIHAIILDKTKIPAESLHFDENLTSYEDYLLLLNLGRTFSPLFVKAVLCIYNIENEDVKLSNYKKNKVYIESKKKEIIKSMPLIVKAFLYYKQKERNSNFIKNAKIAFYRLLAKLVSNEKKFLRIEKKILKYTQVKYENYEI